MAIIDVDSKPPKIRCGIMPGLTVKSGARKIVAITAAPKVKEIGTPMAKNTIILPNNSAVTMLIPSFLIGYMRIT